LILHGMKSKGTSTWVIKRKGLRGFFSQIFRFK
jgi:hypothetical protein